MIEKIGGSALPPSATDCEPLTEEPFNPDMPLRWDVMKVLHSDPRLEKVDDDTILMSTDRFGVLLTKASCEGLDQSDDHSETRVVDCASHPANARSAAVARAARSINRRPPPRPFRRLRAGRARQK